MGVFCKNVKSNCKHLLEYQNQIQVNQSQTSRGKIIKVIIISYNYKSIIC